MESTFIRTGYKGKIVVEDRCFICNYELSHVVSNIDSEALSAQTQLQTAGLKDGAFEVLLESLSPDFFEPRTSTGSLCSSF